MQSVSARTRSTNTREETPQSAAVPPAAAGRTRNLRGSSSWCVGESEPAEVPTACSKKPSVWQMNGSNSGSRSRVLRFEHVNVTRAHAFEVRHGHFTLVSAALAEKDLSRHGRRFVNVVPSVDTTPAANFQVTGFEMFEPHVAIETRPRRDYWTDPGTVGLHPQTRRGSTPS